jgi:hypothetical protein
MSEQELKITADGRISVGQRVKLERSRKLGNGRIVFDIDEFKVMSIVQIGDSVMIRSPTSSKSRGVSFNEKSCTPV